MTEKTKTFSIYAKIDSICSIEISAKSFDDAVQKAKELKEEDFLEYCGDLVDRDFKITGVLEN